MFPPLKTEKPLRPAYMGFVENEVAVVQYKLLQFFITVIQCPAVTLKTAFADTAIYIYKSASARN
jgi:hypothetical protein